MHPPGARPRAQPILDSAKEAVNCIKSENLTEIRALKMPPDPIRDVLEGVLCVMGPRPPRPTPLHTFSTKMATTSWVVVTTARIKKISS